MAVATALNSDYKDIQNSCEFVELNNASKHICLAGVYVTNNVKGFERCSGSVVKSKTYKLFPLKDVSERDEIVHFTNEKDSEIFFHFLSNFGYSAALQNHKRDVEKNQLSDLHTFYCRSSVCVVNVREWTPSVNDLSLSRLAIRSLKVIEEKLMGKDSDRKPAEDDCISFFKMFGTHVYLTNVTVGGIYSISAKTTLQKHDDIESTIALVQEIHNKDISDHLFKDTKAERTEIKEMKDNGKEKPILENKIEAAHRKLGGPQNTCYLSEWKAELMKNPETWTVSDMGEISFENCIGIWSLVKKHHKSFSNAEKLSCFLAEIWVNHVAHGIQCYDLLRCSRQTFVETLKSKLSTPSISWYLESLRDLLQFLEHTVALVGKPMVMKAVDIFSEPCIITLFKESAKYKRPVNICFQILTTKLNILQIERRGSSLASEGSWITSDYFIPGMLSQRELNNVEALLDILESELLPGFDALQAYYDAVPKKVQSLTKCELKDTVQKFLQKLIDREKYPEALLLLVILIYIGYHFKKKEIRTDITFELLADFISSAKGEISLAKKYKDRESQEAWLLLRLVFKLDTQYRIYDASIVLADELNNFRCFLKEKNFILHSKIKNALDSKHKKDCPHAVIHSLAEISRYPCEMFDGETMRKTSSKNPEFAPDIPSDDPLYHMIEKFGMEDFFPRKLSTKHVLELSDALFTTRPTKLKDIPWTVFQHIIAMNFDFRDTVLSGFFKQKPRLKKRHPMDVFLALWHCCDPFLKKLLASKIATCQLALPFIYEDITSRDQLTMSLWPIRDIFIDDSPDSVLTKSLMTVGFIRVGELKSISKSKIINKMMRGESNDHDTFYHRDCALAESKRLISNGLVEITWYVPKTNNGDDVDSTKTEEVLKEFSQPICILNMRGDAKDFRTQLSALLALSDVVVVMSEFENLNDEQSLQVLKEVQSSPSIAIIMADFPNSVENEDIEEESDDEEEKIEEENDERDERNDMSLEEHSGEDLHLFFEAKTGLNHQSRLFISTLDNGKTLNQSGLKDRLTTQIISAVKHIKCLQSLEGKTMLLPTSVTVDEDNERSKYGSNLSEIVFADVESVNMIQGNQIKDKVLPLQRDDIWHTWCLMQKRCFRSGKTSLFENVHQKTLMKTLRLWQVMYGLETQNTIVKFVNVLASHIDDKETITYFLHNMKIQMDLLSRQVMPKLTNDLFKTFKKFETLRSQSDVDKKKLETMKSQIKSKEKILANASFGLEHFFREMGQLYESFLHCIETMFIRVSSKTKLVLEKMPQIAAQLLVWGHPLEIMDGDAASVPENWIKAVFKEIGSIIEENKTMYIISILGIQSSGKSTLLNTMFGLQFSVSAGRCTRGIYAQLIPVDKTKSSLRFDYALILDTEGLRAPESAGEKHVHDNELATLVIGLADVALINIKGETLADMQDVLEIVLHALIRLKNANEKLNIKKSCVFLHQNVSASNAKMNTFTGSQKVDAVLNEMTNIIAKQEKIANITQLSDVLVFNPDENVIHIPDLWLGIPPMAPASQEYSKKVVQVAKRILVDLCENKNSFLNCENTSLHLHNLWKGILSEDFVFSFKNVLEVKAFTLLETEFQKIIWTLEAFKLENIQEVCEIGYSETLEGLQSTITDIEYRFHKNLEEKTKQCKKELQTFFETSELSDYMVHWRAHKTEELTSISKKIATEIDTKIQSERTKCEKLLASKQKLSSVKTKVINKAMEFATTDNNEKDRMSETEIRSKFRDLWKTWLKELAPDVSTDIMQTKITEMKTEIKREIRNKFSNQKALYEKMSDMKLPSVKTLKDCIKTEDMDVKDIEVTGIKENISVYGNYNPEKKREYLSNKNYFKKAKDILDMIFSKIEDFMEKRDKHVEFNSAHFIEVLKFVTVGFRDHNDGSDTHGYMITTTLEIKTVLMVEGYVIKRFEQHIRDYETDNSLRSKMEKYKNEVESLFVTTYLQTAGDEIAASIISKHLKDVLNGKLIKNLYIHIVRTITSNFGNRKESLIKAVLTDLATKHKFSDYILYITNPKYFVELWIKEYTSMVFDQKDTNGVSEYQRHIEIKLSETCETVKQCAGNGAKKWEQWIGCFKDKLKKESLHLPDESLRIVSELNVKDIDFFSKKFNKQLDICRNSLLITLKGVSVSQRNWGDTDPYQEIINNLWKCHENCPWCLEPCIVSSPEDRHLCKQHRPGGIAGVHRVTSRQLTCESCDFEIQSTTQMRCGTWCKCKPKTDIYHPCKEYKKYMKKPWDIPASSNMSSSKYWIWVFREFEKDFGEYHRREPPRFPETDEFKVSKTEAIKSLSTYN